MTDQYLVPLQARDREPTPYEMKLAGSIEEVFGSGRHDLHGLVTGLNDIGLLAPDGAEWSEDSFTAEMKRLSDPESGA